MKTPYRKMHHKLYLLSMQLNYVGYDHATKKPSKTISQLIYKRSNAYLSSFNCENMWFQSNHRRTCHPLSQLASIELSFFFFFNNAPNGKEKHLHVKEHSSMIIIKSSMEKITWHTFYSVLNIVSNLKTQKNKK